MKESSLDESGFRRSSLPKIIMGAVLVVAGAFYFYKAYQPARELENLERRAGQVITGARLQDWATNYIALHPTNSFFRLSELDTNFPSQLRNLAPRLGPTIEVYQSPPSICISWGGGFLGSAGFEIGATNFVGRGHQWQQPGVYFFKTE